MSWAKLDDRFHSHPKVLELLAKGDDGAWALCSWTLGLSHCSANLTNGYIKVSAVVRLTGSLARAQCLAGLLVEVGLWEVAADGWLFHDYLVYNPTKEKVLAAEAARKEGGQKGAANRWGKSKPIGQAIGQPMGQPLSEPKPSP